MLGASLFFAAIVALAAALTLQGSLAFARVSARHAAEHYAVLALAEARTALVSAIGAQIASRVPSLEAPPPMPAAPACGAAADGESCSFFASTTFAITGVTGGDTSSNVEATDMQTHVAIAEGRVAAQIVETISSAAGVVLATRTEFVTLRTFAVPPFAAIDGVTDAGGARDAPFEADAGGCDPASPAACDAANTSAGATSPPAGSMNPGDTRIRALAQCVDGGTGACGGAIYVPADPPNQPAQTPWFNGNAQTGGWAR